MLRRCHDPKNHKFPIYGGRGISVCGRWACFDGFLADMGEKPQGMTLDRIDVDGNYEPANCRWASPKVQANNRTSNRLIGWRGETKTCSVWADALGISFVALRMRLHRGWSVDRAFTEPLRRWP
jgi:hypothetical protein